MKKFGMWFMGYCGKIAIVVMFFVSFAGCGSVKVADRVDAEVRDKSKVDVVETHAEQTKIECAATIASNEDETVVEEVVEVAYDTDKPTDPDTGKPPVKSETTKKKTTVKGRQVQAQTNVVAEHAAVDSTADKTQRDVDIDVEVEHEETPQKSRLAYIFYILLIAAGGGSAWFLNRKFKWIK